MKALIVILILALLFTGCPGPAPDINAYYCKADYTPYVLIDNPSARNASYTELVTFLNTFKPEVTESKTCGHYAEELHNYSEGQGIRCAVVVANAHAFNGFRTDGIMTQAKHIIRYGEAIASAASDYRPNYLTSYLYELAQKFSTFYTSCPVLIAEPEKRPTRLLLCDLTARTIRHGLRELLGISVVEQM